MSRAFSDPVLTVLSRKLRDIDFEPDDTLDHGADALTVMHGVQLFPVNKKNPSAPREYAVVLHVAQKQRIIGKTKWRAAACRFADMAKLKFFKHRQRNATPPTDADLNFTVAQATSDLQFETNAVALLDEIEQHFIAKGFWKPGGAIKETRNNNVRSERWTLTKRITALEAEVEVLKEKLDGLTTLAQLEPKSFKQPASPCPIEAMVQHSKEFFKEAQQTNIDPIADLLP